MPVGAIGAIARSELRRRLPSLAALSLLAALVSGFVVATAAVARRTATAYDRLEAAAKIEDLRIQVYGGQELAEEIVALPSVRHSWVAGTAVAEVAGPEVTYLGLAFGPPRPPDLFQPIVVEGRAARDDAPDEVVMLEPAAEGVHPGDLLSLRFITPQEFRQFDTGFGEPDGPAVDVRVTGLVRIPGGEETLPPLLGTPAFAARYGDQVRVAHWVSLSHHPGSGAELDADLGRMREAAHRPPQGGEEFPAFEARSTARAAAEVATTAAVLVAGLVVMAVAAGVAGLLALNQALARHQAAGQHEQAVEAALGLTPAERVITHAVPTALVAAGAVVGAIAGGLVAGRMEPLGSLRLYEPHPGWAPNVGMLAIGALVMGTVVLCLGAVTAYRFRARRRPGVLPRPGPLVERATTISAPPPVVIGLRLALARGRDRAQVPVWSSLMGTVVGVAGVIVTATFAVNLHRLVTTPARYGWPLDFLVADVTDEDLTRLVGDPRLAAVADAGTATIRLAGRTETALALDGEGGKGSISWLMAKGRLPLTPDEVALGARLASDRSLVTGDVVEALDRQGKRHRLRVVGVGWWPLAATERFAESAILTHEALERYGESEPFREAFVDVGPADPEQVTAELAEEYELIRPQLPAEVDNLRQLGPLPLVLGGFLASVGTVALAHSLVMAIRRRASDLAVLRVVGLAPWQAAGTLAVMALTTVVLGLIAGIPTGLALGRLLWRAVAEGAAVPSDVLLPAELLAVVVPAGLIVALAVSAWPAWRAARLRPAKVLRAE